MVKYNLKDIKRAIELIEKAKTNDNISVYLTPKDVLVLEFFDDFSQDKISINIYDAELNIFAKVVRTERL